jgi:DNA-binding CsgD family transcriptional regulator
MDNVQFDMAASKVENILPTERSCPKGLDYSIIELKKGDWQRLADLSRSIVLVLDCYENKFVFVSDNLPESSGIDRDRLIREGHAPIVEIMHPDDLQYGLLMRERIYAVLGGFPPEEKMKYKLIHEMRVKNRQDEYIRIIEQEQVVELDNTGNIWLMMSVIDVDASHESEVTRSHLYNFETGEQMFINLSDTLEEPITAREVEVLQMMKHGLLSKEIADVMQVSINTVNSHRQNILRKLNVNNTIEAVNLAQRLGLLI